MAADDKTLVVNVLAFVANVAVSVVTIFVLKALMSAYHFTFATSASGLHFLCCVLAVWVAERMGYSSVADMPVGDAILYAAVGASSIGTANLSLLLNSVGFYQIAKLLQSPFVCVVEITWLGKRFPTSVLVCSLVVLVGVAIVTVSDVAVHPPGVAMAMLFTVTGGMQQILCGQMQKKHNLTSHQLMSNTSFYQSMILLILGPFIDRWVSNRWLLEWEVNVPGLQMLGLSCVLAIGVNVTQFLCLGRFTATSFQVLGHAKTLLVIMGGWALFGEEMNARKVAGMSLAFAGMVGYGYFASRAPKSDAVADEATQRLLPAAAKSSSGRNDEEAAASTAAAGGVVGAAAAGTARRPLPVSSATSV